MPGHDRVVQCNGRKGYRWRVKQWCPRRAFRLQIITLDGTIICWYSPNHGYYAAESSRGKGVPPRPRVIPFVGYRTMKKVNLAGSSETGGASHVAAIESNVLSSLQPLVNHCCVTRYDDGTVRTPGTVQLRTQGSAWAIQVVDPDSCAFFTALGNTVDEALALASLLLESESAPWELARWLMAKKSKK